MCINIKFTKHLALVESNMHKHNLFHITWQRLLIKHIVAVVVVFLPHLNKAELSEQCSQAQAQNPTIMFVSVKHCNAHTKV
jgi:flagellar basal body-associated protein FliL